MLRLPIKHLHRAFPELDSYSDEQCLRFIHAARGSVRRRALHVVLIAFATMLTLAVGISLAGYLLAVALPRTRTLDISNPAVPWYGIVVNIAIAILGVAVGPFTGYLVRDFLLIRRVRHILRTRGTCISCRYTLVGLVVAPDLKVTCPECGTTATVDPSLGELTTDEAGRPRFKPDESRHKARTFWTDTRRRRLKRATPWLAALLVGPPILLAGSYEGFIRWQASVARSERPGIQSINDAMLTLATRTSRPGQSNAWDAFDHAILQRHEVDQATWRAAESKDFVWPEYSLIFTKPRRLVSESEIDAERDEQERRGRELALNLIERYREAGIYETLDTLAASPLSLRLIDHPKNAPLIDVLLPHLGEARQLALLCAARAHLAARASDLPEFASALESGLALVRLLEARVVMIECLVAAAIEDVVLDRLFDTLSRPVSAEWVEAMAGALERQVPREPGLEWLEAERAIALDSVAWIFSDPKNVRLGRWSPPLASFVHQSAWFQIAPLGTYRQNTRTFNDAFDAIRTYAEKPIAARSHSDGSTPYEYGDLLLFDSLFPSLRRGVNAMERRAIRRRAAFTMIAIERHRIAHGHYPDTLSALVPEFLDAVPIDPWSANPLRYKRIDPDTDPHARGYLLYSVGVDLIDDGGIAPEPRFRDDTLGINIATHARGTDYIFNQPLTHP